MTASDMLRIRVEPGFKQAVSRMYEQRGTTVSQAVRAFLADELSAYGSSLDAFDAIMSSADAKTEASGMREPSIEEINNYIEQVRSERAGASLVAS